MHGPKPNPDFHVRSDGFLALLTAHEYTEGSEFINTQEAHTAR